MSKKLERITAAHVQTIGSETTNLLTAQVLKLAEPPESRPLGPSAASVGRVIHCGLKVFFKGLQHPATDGSSYVPSKYSFVCAHVQVREETTGLR